MLKIINLRVGVILPNKIVIVILYFVSKVVKI